MVEKVRNTGFTALRTGLAIRLLYMTNSEQLLRFYLNDVFQLLVDFGCSAISKLDEVDAVT